MTMIYLEKLWSGRSGVPSLLERSTYPNNGATGMLEAIIARARYWVIIWKLTLALGSTLVNVTWHGTLITNNSLDLSFMDPVTGERRIK